MRQTLALFIDAYRELNARKMFWITLILSGVVVSTLLFIGVVENPQSTSSFDSQHLKVMFWEIPVPIPQSIDLEDLLKGVFVTLGISIWLTWAATILALISTAGIFPDFLSAGAIDLVLHKPISRLRIFLTKYAGGLLFVALQVTVFSTAAFVIVGLRAGSWEPAFFLAIPLVVAFFSFLFSVSVLIGTLTRSAITSLLVTMLFWVLLFALNITDEGLSMPRVTNEIYVEKLDEKLIELRNADDANSKIRVPVVEKQLEEATESRDLWRKWHGLVYGIKTALPKTGETKSLLKRQLIERADLPDIEEKRPDMPFINAKMIAVGVRTTDVVKRIEDLYLDRTVTWILGTSLIFEAFVLSIACWVFCRRDY